MLKPLAQRLAAFALTAAALLTALTACAAPEPTPDIPATVAAQVQAQLTAIPTATPPPTNTPYPTFTPKPTYTPYPTLTPLPTYTPYPTATPPPELPTPTLDIPGKVEVAMQTPLPATPTAPSTPTIIWMPGPVATATPTLQTGLPSTAYTRYRPPTPTAKPTPTPTPPPVSWTEYQRNIVQDVPSGVFCTQSDYTIEIPPGWVLDYIPIFFCEDIEFRTVNEDARVRIYLELMPNFSADPDEAFHQVSEYYAQDYSVEDFQGYVTHLKVLTSEQIQHRGYNALLQTLEIQRERPRHCTGTVTRLIVLSEEWRSEQYAHVVSAERCKVTGAKYDSDLKRVLESFSPIAPYSPSLP